MLKVDRMVIEPQRCLACGRGGTVPYEDGSVGPVLDLQAEVGWGDPTYLCQECVARIALLFDYMSPDDVKELEREVSRQKKKNHALKADNEAQARRLSRILKGRKELKKLREEAA